VLVKQSLVKSVADFDQMAVVCKSVPGVLVPCGDVHYLGEKDEDDDFAVLHDIDL